MFEKAKIEIYDLDSVNGVYLDTVAVSDPNANPDGGEWGGFPEH